MAEQQRIEYYELSAKTGQNVEYIFRHAAELLTRQLQDKEGSADLENVLSDKAMCRHKRYNTVAPFPALSSKTTR